jgi:hypothetical protein
VTDHPEADAELPDAHFRRSRQRALTEVGRVETWFLDQGVPFVVRFAAGQRIIARMTPGLFLIFTTGLALFVARLITGDLQRPFWQALADTDFSARRLSVSGLVIIVGFVGGLAAASWASRSQDRRSWLLGSSPGLTLVAGMLLICIVHAVVATSVGAMFAELGTFATALVVLFLFVRSGLSALLAWAVRRAVPRYRDLVRLLTRALPLQLVLVAFLFINPDTWQLAYALGTARLAVLVGLFALAATLFLITQVPREVRAIDVGLAPEQVQASCARTPLERLATIVDPSMIRPHPLSRRERLNLTLTITFAQAIQVLTLGLLMLAFLVIFGVVAVDASVAAAWVQATPAEVTILGVAIPGVTPALLKVAVVVASFSAMQFAVQALTDAGYRHDFFDDLVRQLSDTMVAREVYLAGLEQHELAPAVERFSWRALAPQIEPGQARRKG